MLKLADNLKLPLEAVTEKIAFLGRTGTGKTYAAMKLAEAMLEAGAQVVALDAVGKWYGLRVAGAGPGFAIPVFGGLNGDFPLEATGGKLMADIITDRAISAVLDVSQFTKSEQNRFALDFATQFYQRKKSAPSAVHLFLEECQEFVPQNTMPGEQQMLAAFERLWKLGRNFGIGGSLISQRPQEINKKALNQTGTLFVFGMTGPQERKAIEQWVSAQGINEDIGEILPTLKQGEPHVWSPTFLGISKTVRIAEKRTADVSTTPKVGARAKEKPLTPIDAPQLAEQMAATVERAKADDPRELRKMLAEKDKELKRLQSLALKPAPSDAAAKQEVKRVEVLTDADRALLAKLADGISNIREFLEGGHAQLFDEARDRMLKVLHVFRDDSHADIAQMRAEFERRLDSKGFQKILAKLATVENTQATMTQRVGAVTPQQRQPPLSPHGRRAVPAATASRPASVHPSSNGHGLTPAKQKILNGLAFLHGIGVAPADKTQLALIVGVSPTSGGYFNNLGALRSDGLIEYPSGGTVALTQGGEKIANTDGVPSTTEELHDAVRGKLPPAKWRIVEELIKSYPDALTKDALAKRIGVSPTSGGFFNNLGSLRSLGLIDYPQPGTAAALPVLFLEG